MNDAVACIWTLLGEECRAQRFPWTCEECLPRSLVAYGHFLRRPDDEHPTVFVAHLPGAPSLVAETILGRLQGLGLFVSVVDGDDGTCSVVISAEPLPAYTIAIEEAA